MTALPQPPASRPAEIQPTRCSPSPFMQASPPLGASRMHAARTSRTGLLLGFGAYVLWGVLPLYFKLVAAVPPFDIVAHRVLWSLPFLALLIALGKGWPKVRECAADPR